MSVQQSACRNLILSRLAAEDFALLGEHLEPLACPRASVLNDHDEEMTHVHFLEKGMASIVATSPEGQLAEAGVIGREGFLHPALALGSRTIPHRVQMQLEGSGHRIERDIFLTAMRQSERLRDTLGRFAQVMLVQSTFTALSNAVHSTDERLARWLLMVHDRSDSDDLAITHEFMAIMLSVRRPSVTNALHVLEGNGFIQGDRGYVGIRNRAALEDFARDAYGRPEAEYRELLGPLR